MPPSSVSSLHFSNSFPHGGMPGMWVVGKAFKNTPGDKNALVLKASLLAKRRCMEGSWLPPLLGFWDIPALPRLAGRGIISLIGKGSPKELSTKDQLHEVLCSTCILHQKIKMSNSFRLPLSKEHGSPLILHTGKLRHRHPSSHLKKKPTSYCLDSHLEAPMKK